MYRSYSSNTNYRSNPSNTKLQISQKPPLIPSNDIKPYISLILTKHQLSFKPSSTKLQIPLKTLLTQLHLYRSSSPITHSPQNLSIKHLLSLINIFQCNLTIILFQPLIHNFLRMQSIPKTYISSKIFLLRLRLILKFFSPILPQSSHLPSPSNTETRQPHEPQ
jgi:hypothetical protein